MGFRLFLPGWYTIAIAGVKPMHINVRVLTEKVRKFIEIEEEEALVGTIKFRRPKLDPESEKGSRFARTPNLGIPGLCPDRPVSIDGRVAFHLKHTFVVKKASYGSKQNGKEPGAANAVALVVSGDSDGFSTDAADHESYISRQGAAITITAAQYDQYIEGGVPEGGAGFVISNISQDLNGRTEFWKAVTRRERNPSPDRVTLYPDRLSGEQWARVLETYQGSPAILSNLAKLKLRRDEAEALDLKDHSVAFGFELEFREFTKLRKHLRHLGFWDRDRPAAEIKRGRGGRVQRRMVAEFPLGLNDAARLRILHRFADYLGGKGMMYTAVIHPPDAHNDKRNYHLHVAAYDRPCRYLEEHGCWDFDYAVRVEGQHDRVTFPLRQNKVASLTRPENKSEHRKHGAAVLTELRATFAELCNDELRKLNINRLFDHRSYAVMGIKQQPGKHLGTKAASLEAIGVPTSVGIDNAEKSWQGAFDRVAEAHRVRQDPRVSLSDRLN